MLSTYENLQLLHVDLKFAIYSIFMTDCTYSLQKYVQSFLQIELLRDYYKRTKNLKQNLSQTHHIRERNIICSITNARQDIKLKEKRPFAFFDWVQFTLDP